MKSKTSQFILLAVMVSLLAGSCKKNTDSAPEPLLTRVSYNGVNGYKFYYSDKNQLIRWELFSTDPANNAMSAYFTMEYNNNGQLAEMTTFQMPGDVPYTHIVYKYDQNGRMTGYDSYDLQGPDPSSPGTSSFYYNGQDQLITATLKDEDGEFILQYSLTYYPNGFLKQRDEYEESITNQLRLKSRTIYSVPVTDEIKGWDKITVIPLLGDEVTRNAKYSTIQRYTYNNGVLVHHISETISAKEYNSDGTLKRHTSTTQHIVPPDTEAINNWEFEYITQ
jgi:hypothetical protein